MKDPIIRELFGGDMDEKRAKWFADEIAASVNSRVLPNDEVILGEGYYPFKVSFHTKTFHCFLFVSDASYCFTATRRPKTPWVEDFRVSFKEPDPESGVRILSPKLSKLVGVKVFRLPRCPDDATDIAFSPAFIAVLRKIKLNRVQLLHLSPIGLNVVASLDSPQFCVEQAVVFQELVALANQEAFERNEDALD